MARAKQASTATRTVTDPKQLQAQGWLDTLTFLRDQKGAEIIITKGRSGIDLKATFPQITDEKGSHLMISGHPYSGKVQAVWYNPNTKAYSDPTFFEDVSVWNVGVDKQGKLVRVPQDFEAAPAEATNNAKIPF